MSVGTDKIKIFQSRNYKIYIYGTGLWGRSVYDELKKNGIRIDGFVVTKRDNLYELKGIPVFEYFELTSSDIVLVLGLNQHNTKEVFHFLLENGFEEAQIVYSNEVMAFQDSRCGYDEVPCLDITTRIGCSVNCKYCPQDVLLEQYYKKDLSREKLLTLDTLMKCVEHMPENAAYQFGGMAEAFLNPNCYELIRAVCDMGHVVNLYTTLVGMDQETLYKVMELPIDYVTLHVADTKRYANIPPSDEYYRLLEIAINGKKKNGKMFVDMCNAQAEPDERVAQLCEGKHIISSTLLDRAGNLKGEGLVSKKLTTGPITCGVCGMTLNKNELLPDGTLLLCCMDYAMKHELGNLKRQTYKEILESAELKRIKDAMKTNFGESILCRSCSCANLES